MSGRRWLLIGLIAVVGAVVGAALVVGSDGGGSPEEQSFDAERAAEFEAALASRDPAVLGEVLAVNEGLDLARVAREALPPGRRLVIDETSFVTEGGGFGTVEATVRGDGRPLRVTLFLVHDGESWMLSGSTRPVAQ